MRASTLAKARAAIANNFFDSTLEVFQKTQSRGTSGGVTEVWATTGLSYPCSAKKRDYGTGEVGIAERPSGLQYWEVKTLYDAAITRHHRIKIDGVFFSVNEVNEVQTDRFSLTLRCTRIE